MRKHNSTARGRTLRISAVVVFAFTTLALPTASNAAANGSSTVTTISIPAKAGEVSSKWLEYDGDAQARVLLPPSYNPNTAYPLVVLLHGLNGQYTDWTDPTLGDAQQVLNGLNAIVVMPSGGNGWYTDWYNEAAYGNPSWESYILNEVLPQIQQRYKILPQRQYHALVGVSMGGLGAAYLGGRLPGFFGTVGIISGFVDPQYLPLVPEGMSLFGGASDLAAVYGPDYGSYASGHNPTNLAVNLQDTHVYMTAGNGLLSSRGFSSPSNLAEGIVFEGAIIRPMSNLYDNALQKAGVDVRYVTGNGIHDWPDARYALSEMRAWGLFNPVVSSPSSWTNKTVAKSGQLWDVGYTFDNQPEAIVTFHQTGSTLTISGASTPVTITTQGGCVLHATEPATLSLPSGSCSPQLAKP